MKVNESNFREILFVDNWVRGFVAFVGLGFLFGAFAVAGSFWRVVKFVLVLFPLLSVLQYFTLYRSVIGKKLREEGKTVEVAIKETEAYVDRGVVEVFLLFPIVYSWSVVLLQIQHTPFSTLSPSERGNLGLSSRKVHNTHRHFERTVENLKTHFTICS
ncbi:hypothetical protein APY94_08920 [Thermococcus celericrescens]|uniref:Uncharacterized protein n=1 Tax=Thermococcus celericrescens TaxID=227598 RepID=A0A124EB74_9EURY|nr:hypothetical protein [Thermococcus celericrescens]KUH32732.1 hypothetical protein APY94_08920 [Thermococcus celericrescens]